MGPLGIRRPPEWGVDPTPEKVRILRTFDLFVFWASLAVGLLVFAAGALLVTIFGLNLKEVIIVTIIGSVIGALLLAGAGMFGAKYGVPAMVSLRPVLGKKGSYVPSALNILQLVGWTSFELYIMGLAATILSGPILGELTIFFWIIVFSLVVVAFAIGGPLIVIRAWLEKVAIWLVFISTAIIVYVVFIQPISWDARFVMDLTATPPVLVESSGATISLLLAVDLVIAMPISWWPLVSDYNRFAKSTKDGARGTFMGYMFANFIFFFLGAAMVVATSGIDAIVAIGSLGLGSMILLLNLVDETDNAFADVYSTALSFQNIRKKTKQLTVIGVATAISVLVAGYLAIRHEPIGGGYENFLLIIGAIAVPLLGILIADYFIVRRGSYDIKEFYDAAPSFRWKAFVAWVPGIILYYILSPSLVQVLHPEYQGLPISIGASVPAFILSALLYVGLSRPWALPHRNPKPYGTKH